MNIEEALEIVQNTLDRGIFNKAQEIVFRQSWEGKSYAEMAETSGYEVGYIRDTGSKLWQVLSQKFGKKVTKNNIQGILKQQIYLAKTTATASDVGIKGWRQAYQSIPQLKTTEIAAKQCQDWADAIDVSTFHGRTAELTTLKQWIVQEDCRLVTILGMGGMGKTSLAVKLAQQVQDRFDYVIWRSLRNAPPIQELLGELIQFLSQEYSTSLPATLDGRILWLIDYLRSTRCLLILDNVESILQPCDQRGCYLKEYEGYGQLFRCIADTSHHSCLMLTSREKPTSLATKEGEALPVRSLQLTSLETTAAQEIFQAKGKFWASESEWKNLIEHYAGNPLALKMVATPIQDFSGSNISKFLEFLKQNTLIFDDVRDLLSQQFNRLSILEKEVMYWLAINREPVSLAELQADSVLKLRGSKIIETLASLRRRALIEKSADGFTQHPLVMEYVTEDLIERVCTEITTGKITLLSSHALVKATARDYNKEVQVRVILQPIINRLSNIFSSQKNIENQLQMLSSIQQIHPQSRSGYLGENINNILGQLRTDLSNYDFSNSIIWQAL